MLNPNNWYLRFNKRNAIRFVSVFLVCVVLFATLVVQDVQAATSYFSPSSGSFEVGSIFTVSVSINTKGADINNAEGTVRFPSDLLEVVSVSKSGSIFSLWVEEPNFLNGAGTISFNGGLPTPGFNGSSGKIFSAVFKAKKAGSASVLFSSVSILANDGLGTNVFSGSGSASYDLTIAEAKTEVPTPAKMPEKVPETKVVPEEPSGLPISPRVSSPTNPDQNQWYSSGDARLVWSVPSGVTAVRFLYDASPTSRPTATYQPAISERQLSGMKDGVWYAHVQFVNDKGLGGVTHFRFQIDSQKPDSFEVSNVTKQDLVGTKAQFVFDSKDTLSGIDHYELQIDDRSPEIWKDDGSHRYETPALNPGQYTLNVKAFDKAGNSFTTTIAFTIRGLSSPTITEYPTELSNCDAFIVRGATLPRSEVIVWLQNGKEDPKSFSIQSNRDGFFVFVPEKGLKAGLYTVWTEVIDDQGLKSEPSQKINIRITTPSSFQNTASLINSLSTIMTLLAVIIFLSVVLLYAWYKFFLFRKKVKKEVDEAGVALYEAFNLLRKEIREQVKMLEKTKTRRELTNEEEKVIKQLRKQLDSAEKSVKKEIEDIEKEVK